MGKKKPFINKKNSATFQLLVRDSSASASDPATDRVFVRVDNNPYSIHGLEEEESEQEDADESIFADALNDTYDEDHKDWIGGGGHVRSGGPSRRQLPDHVRKEILEMGLPDDGYNYLLHLREIRNSGGGSTYYENSKAKLHQVPLDVKAYDASRLRIGANASNELNNESNSLYDVASKAVGVKVQRAVDPDVAKLLDDSDLSRFGSDVEDLDEDFVVKANLPDEEEEEVEAEARGAIGLKKSAFLKEEDKFADVDGDDELEEEANDKPRVRRLLDEQFDLLTLREYDGNSDNEDANYLDSDDEPLAVKISDALKPYAMDKSELEDKYRVPGDFISGHAGSENGEELDLPTDVIKKCVEYAEKYYNESQDDKEVVIVEESSDEYEVWDCETIVSTYSNLDNHPGKIQAPGNPKKRVPKIFPGESVSKRNLIELRGKEKLPVEFLPSNKRAVEKVKAAVSSSTEKQKSKPHGEETKLEKKERKAAVKEERREARRAKKELKVLYKCEAQKAQKVAAVAGPSSVHLM